MVQITSRIYFKLSLITNIRAPHLGPDDSSTRRLGVCCLALTACTLPYAPPFIAILFTTIRHTCSANATCTFVSLVLDVYVYLFKPIQLTLPSGSKRYSL